MNDPEFERQRALFEQALERPPGEREAFVATACAGDASLRGAVLALLAADSAGSGASLPVTPPTWSWLARPAVGATVEGRVGPYRLLRVIGVGGMGAVYEAEQDHPRRKVALKTLPFGAASDAGGRRLRQEAAVLASLQHPGIAQVHDAGVHEAEGAAVPYFVMEYVADARDLVSFAKDRGLDQAQRIALFLQVLDAVEHGHARGVVHRDLKPGNVLVDGDGRVKVIDFGIARVTGGATTVTAVETRTGLVLGTLQYMSPEQLIGDTARVGVCSDVYALGVVLYELLIGEPPYDVRGLALPEVVRIVTERPPRRPEGLATDLVAVLATSLAKDPALRYASCAAMADDLRRFQRHEPVLATGPSLVYRAKKFVRRQRLVLGATAAVVVALAFGTWRATSEAREARRALSLAQIEAAKANGVGSFLRKMLTAAGPLSRGQNARVLDVLDEATTLLASESALEPEADAVIRHVLAECYMELRYLERAKAYLDPVLEFVRREKRSDDPLAIQVTMTQGRLLLMSGDFAGARTVLCEVEPLALAVFGERDERMLRLWFSLDEAFAVDGDPAEAVARYDTHLPIVVGVLGDEHPETIGYLGGRACAWRSAGRVTEAREELARVVELAERTLPEGHFRVANAKFNLAATEFYFLQRPERALPILETVAEALQREYGDEHPMLLQAQVVLGDALRATGNPARALEKYRRGRELLMISGRVEAEMLERIDERIRAVSPAPGATPRSVE